MGARFSAPIPEERRFAAYMEGLANARDAALLDPENVQPMRQSLHHLVAKAPWDDEAVLDDVRKHVLPAMKKPGRLLQRSADHQPVSVKQLAMSLPSAAFQEITWREGTDRKLHSRFAAVRVSPAYRDYEKALPHEEEHEEEWPRREKEPTPYWIWLSWPSTAGSSNANMKN